jgi:mannopine transport system permease protein
MVGVPPDQPDRTVRALDRAEIAAQAPAVAPRDRRRARRAAATLGALLPFLLVIVALFAAPTLRVLSKSFLEPAPGLANFAAVFANPLYQQVFWTTLRISATVTLLAIVLAYPVAQFTAECSPLARNVVFAIVLVPFWTSLLVRIYGWTFILQRTGIVNETLQALSLVSAPIKLLYTEGAVVLGILHYMLPFMIFSIYVALKAIDPNLRKAAMTMGARSVRVLVKVTLPLALPGIVTGSLLVFIGSLGFFVTPALMGSPRQMMLANVITFQVQEALDWPKASAIAVVLIAFVAFFALLYFRLVDRMPALEESP